MSLDRRSLLGLAAASLAPPVWAASRPDPIEIIRLWPDGAPGSERVTVKLDVFERSPTPDLFKDRAATGVTDPVLTVFRPPNPDGSAVLIVPGGGYRRVVIDKEGFEAARVLVAAGVTCFVLRYRLPGDGWAAGPGAPAEDARQAMRLIRALPGLDSRRVGVLGFSAGGHLAATLSALSVGQSLPSFAGLLYPVVTMTDPYAHAGSRAHLLGKSPTPAQLDANSREKTVTAAHPPTFLVHAIDDSAVPVENSLMLLAALRAHKVPVEAHLFEEGDHGFGIRLAQGKPAAAWPDLFLTWMSRHGWLRGGSL